MSGVFNHVVQTIAQCWRDVCLWLISALLPHALPHHEEYFDAAASTPVYAESLLAFVHTSMIAGNSHSDNAPGQKLRTCEENARRVIADALGVNADGIVFTSGATEANNIIIQGVAKAYFQRTGRRAHIITSNLEHKSVLAVIENIDVTRTIIQVDDTGHVRPEDVEHAINRNTALVSIHALSNETGAVQNIKRIHNICKRHGVLLHCDASQAFLRCEGIVGDFITISGHKIGAPKGIGAFYVRDRAACHPITYGGGAEKLRPGTLPTELIAAFAAAVRAETLHADAIRKKARYIREKLANIAYIQLIGSEVANSHIVFAKVAHVFQKDLLEHLSDFTVAHGAACDRSQKSHAAQVLGLEHEDEIASFLRLSVHHASAYSAIDRLVQKLQDVRSLQAL